jgi:hypothetical protein
MSSYEGKRRSLSYRVANSPTLKGIVGSNFFAEFFWENASVIDAVSHWILIQMMLDVGV